MALEMFGISTASAGPMAQLIMFLVTWLVIPLCFAALFFIYFFMFGIEANIKQIRGNGWVNMKRPARIKASKDGTKQMVFLFGYKPIPWPAERYLQPRRGLRKLSVDLWGDDNKILHPIKFDPPIKYDDNGNMVGTQQSVDFQNSILWHTLMSKSNAQTYEQKTPFWKEHIMALLGTGVFLFATIVLIVAWQKSADVMALGYSAANNIASAMTALKGAGISIVPPVA